MILKTSAKWDLEDYLMEWSRKLKAFNRMVKIKKLFNEKGQQNIIYFDTLPSYSIIKT